ncbi:uncharacterized protein LOC131604513 [Vicia villosa]|uniref:uncharacterized protein LOC131604513 n=1 Tax=Vicia villosa TaxID=3911 RepID=UPI00273B958F|nr:uncharacterized protein LOC131604513 [Vicia villosa]
MYTRSSGAPPSDGITVGFQEGSEGALVRVNFSSLYLQMQEGGWTRVTYRKSSLLQWDIFPFGGRNQNPSTLRKEITSMFVSEFPEESSAKDLFDLFGCIGSMVEVAISPRRNRVSKRFGFARFVEVSDERLLAVRLDNIIIAGKKIRVNLPRFQWGVFGGAGRFGGSVNSREKNWGAPKGEEQLWYESRRNGKSYAAAVGSGLEVYGKKGETIYSLSLNSCEERRKRFAKAFVGKVCIPDSAFNIQTHLEMEGVFAIRVSPLGGNLCLLEENEEGFIEDLINECEGWWRSWFSEIKKWEEGMVEDSRDMWIRIYGIPALVWHSDFFVALAELWGRFICIDENTSKGAAFAMARMMVNVPISFKLPDSVTVNIDGKSFAIFLREDAMGQILFSSNKQTVASSSSEFSGSKGGWCEDFAGTECSEESIEQFSSKDITEAALVNSKVVGFVHNGVKSK